MPKKKPSPRVFIELINEEEEDIFTKYAEELIFTVLREESKEEEELSDLEKILEKEDKSKDFWYETYYSGDMK